jgi:hypothetical protein
MTEQIFFIRITTLKVNISQNRLNNILNINVMRRAKNHGCTIVESSGWGSLTILENFVWGIHDAVKKNQEVYQILKIFFISTALCASL